jgi:uncharacterized membrane protein YgcG
VSAPLKMKCPSCGRAVTEPVARCPHCRLSLRKLDLQFGAAPRHFGRLSDSVGALSHADERKLQTLLQIFQRKFPQAGFSVFITELSTGTGIDEYTFWLANRVRFGTGEAIAEKNFDLLLVIDTTGGAGLTIGYGLENYLREEDLEAALSAARDPLAAKNWVKGIELCVEKITERMREIAREAIPRKAVELKTSNEPIR